MSRSFANIGIMSEACHHSYTCACHSVVYVCSRRLGVFAVDIDRASGRQVEFGHEVVEIETMSKESDVLSARDSITALARSLGARREGESGRPVKVRCFMRYLGVSLMLMVYLGKSYER